MKKKVEDYISYIRDEKRYASTTVTSYKSELRRFSKYLEDKEMTFNDLNSRSIRKYLSTLVQSGLKIKTVRVKISRINTFFTFLKKRQGLQINPVFGIRLPRSPRQVPIIVPKKIIQALVEQRCDTPSVFKDVRDNLIIQILFQTGIRRSELADLKTADIDFVQKQMKVFGKGRKERIIPFGTKLNELLKSYLQLRDFTFKEKTPEFLMSLKSKKMSTDTIYVIVRQNLSKLNISKQHPHTLRHIFATQLHENGGDIQEIKELLGHVQISTTQIYTHSSFTALEKNYQKYFLFKKNP